MFLLNFITFISFIMGIRRRCFVSYMHIVGGMIIGAFLINAKHIMRKVLRGKWVSLEWKLVLERRADDQ